MDKNRLRDAARNNIVTIMFIVLCTVCMAFSGYAPNYVLYELFGRLSRNMFIVLSLIIPIVAGMGINFAITIGAMAAQIACLLVLEWGVPGIGGLALAALLTVPLGGIFGFVSFMDAIKGASIMTSTLLGVSAVHTFILCFGMRLLMGLCVGIVYRAMTKACKNGTANCFAASLSAPLLNTLFFMGYIVLVFYHTDYVQSLVLAKGASNPLMFVVLLTGVQGAVEAIVCSVAGTAIGGALLKVTGRMNGHR